MKNNKLLSWELELLTKINSLLSEEESEIFKYQIKMYNYIYIDIKGRVFSLNFSKFFNFNNLTNYSIQIDKNNKI